jgi:hypothetical protein
MTGTALREPELDQEVGTRSEQHVRRREMLTQGHAIRNAHDFFIQ